MNLSLVVPTYNEKGNIEQLLREIRDVLTKEGITFEIIVVDDGSPDGTGEIVEHLIHEDQRIQIIHRNKKEGLSSAVIEGFRKATGDIVGVMDADFSHPIESLPYLYQEIIKGRDIVIGSRYVHGGRIENWSFMRKLISRFATFPARVFTPVHDPMSGFFFLRKSILNDVYLDSRGFKLLLEILIKTGAIHITEVPIVFKDRTTGKSKAGIHEFMYYIRNLISYLPYKKEVMEQFMRFSIVGALGTVINIVLLYLITEKAGVYYVYSAIIAFIVAATSNFICNKLWTFSENLEEQFFKKLGSFFAVSVTALIVNVVFLYICTEYLNVYYVISEILAIGVSLVVNFFGNKIWTFST